MSQVQKELEADRPEAVDRRNFLATAGKFAAVVPPAMTVLLSTSMSSPAIAASGGSGGSGGSGEDCGDEGHSWLPKHKHRR